MNTTFLTSASDFMTHFAPLGLAWYEVWRFYKYFAPLGLRIGASESIFLGVAFVLVSVRKNEKCYGNKRDLDRNCPNHSKNICPEKITYRICVSIAR